VFPTRPYTNSSKDIRSKIDSTCLKYLRFLFAMTWDKGMLLTGKFSGSHLLSHLQFELTPFSILLYKLKSKNFAIYLIL
jgi:hypothetical protein